MMGNFMCQFDWATGYTDIWPNIILGVPLRVFWGGIETDLSKFSSLNVGLIQSIESMNKQKRLTLFQVKLLEIKPPT